MTIAPDAGGPPFFCYLLLFSPQIFGSTIYEQIATELQQKEREKLKRKKKQDKAEKREERKANAQKGLPLEEMFSYVDENGNLTSTPPDPSKRIKIKAEDIPLGVPKREEIDPADLIRTGKVTTFYPSKGYGFIRDLDSQESLFFHVKSLPEGVQVDEGDTVNFEVEMGPKGANAANVRPA